MKFFVYNKLLFRLLLLLLAGAGSVFFYQRPHSFWDMLPYMGCVASVDNADSTFVHETTYADFRAQAPAEMQASMIDGHPYCKTLSENADYFHQHLPFFHAKPLYVYISWVSWKCGFSLFHSVMIPVLLAFLLFAWIVYRWLEEHFAPAFAFLFAVLLLSCSFNRDVFRIASPDALSGVFILAGSYFVLEKKNMFCASIFLALSVYTRMDNLFFAVPLLSLLAVFYRKKEKRNAQVALAGALLGCVLFLIAHRQSGYDAWRMFYRAFVDLVVNPYDVATAFNLPDYLQGLKKGLSDSARNVGIYLVVIFSGLHAWRNRVRLFTEEGAWLAALGVSLGTKLVLHPAFEDRYLFSFITVLVIVLLRAGLRERMKRFSGI